VLGPVADAALPLESLPSGGFSRVHAFTVAYDTQASVVPQSHCGVALCTRFPMLLSTTSQAPPPPPPSHLQEGCDRYLDMHTDASDVTFNVCLGKEFTGVSLWDTGRGCLGKEFTGVSLWDLEAGGWGPLHAGTAAALPPFTSRPPPSSCITGNPVVLRRQGCR
jgi:hypothetical protein